MTGDQIFALLSAFLGGFIALAGGWLTEWRKDRRADKQAKAQARLADREAVRSIVQTLVRKSSERARQVEAGMRILQVGAPGDLRQKYRELEKMQDLMPDIQAAAYDLRILEPFSEMARLAFELVDLHTSIPKMMERTTFSISDALVVTQQMDSLERKTNAALVIYLQDLPAYLSDHYTGPRPSWIKR